MRLRLTVNGIELGKPPRYHLPEQRDRPWYDILNRKVAKDAKVIFFSDQDE
jgi:hypothetical protein